MISMWCRWIAQNKSKDTDEETQPMYEGKTYRDDDKMWGLCNKLPTMTFKLKLYLTLTVGGRLPCTPDLNEFYKRFYSVTVDLIYKPSYDISICVKHVVNRWLTVKNVSFVLLDTLVDCKWTLTGTSRRTAPLLLKEIWHVRLLRPAGCFLLTFRFFSRRCSTAAVDLLRLLHA
jgi:hypothetical protein